MTEKTTSNSCCSQKRRRTQKAEQGDSTKEYPRKKARKANDMSLCESISTSTSRPPGKKILFVLPHSGRNTEERTQPTANFSRQTHHGTTDITSSSTSAVEPLSGRALGSTATTQARYSSTFPNPDAAPGGSKGMPVVSHGRLARSSSNTIANERHSTEAHGREISAPTVSTSQHASSTAATRLVSVPLGQLKVQHGVHSLSLQAPRSMAQDYGLFFGPAQGSVNVLQGQGSLPGDRPRASQNQRKKIKITDDAGGQKPEVELACPERRTVDVKSLCAELQLKTEEVQRAHTEVAERNAVIAKLQAALVERETALCGVQVLVSDCHRLLGALEAGQNTCQSMLDRMQTTAARDKGEELRTHNTDASGQKPVDRLDGDALSIHEAKSVVRSSHLSGHTDNGAWREEEQFVYQDLDSWARRWRTSIL